VPTPAKPPVNLRRKATDKGRAAVQIAARPRLISKDIFYLYPPVISNILKRVNSLILSQLLFKKQQTE
jgi:hypothetical protein